jgi:hypothetical protein
MEEKEMVATGEAAVIGEGENAVTAAREQAINRAQRRAIEEGVGTIIDSETMVENFQLIDDKILSQVKGYITGYEIINDNNGEDGVYKITIKADVALAHLEKDVKALNIIKEKKNNPRIMVIFTEVTEDPIIGADWLKAGGTGRAAIEKELLKLDIPVIDRAQMKEINERDMTIAYNNPSKAAALGKRFGADIVIVGTATSALMDTSSPHGVAVFHCDAQASARAIKTDTAQVIASESVDSGRVVKGGRATAAREAVKIAAEKLAGEMSNKIIENWRSEVFNTVVVEIVATDANNDKREAFKKDLAGIRGVKSVNERSWADELLVLDVVIDGAIWGNFEQLIRELPDVGVELTGKTQNRIDVKLKGKGKILPE